MMRSLYSGVSGLRNHQTRMDVIGNNIANVNTVGFKASRTIFQDMYSQNMRAASSPGETTGGTNPQQIGLGMTLSTIDTLFTRSAAQVTGNTYDLMIENDGFFIVRNGFGNTYEEYYTRAGNFYEDKTHYLVTANGFYLQGFKAGLTKGDDPVTGNPATVTSIAAGPVTAGTAAKATISAAANYVTLTNNRKDASLNGKKYDVTVTDNLDGTFDIQVFEQGNATPIATQANFDPTAGPLALTVDTDIQLAADFSAAADPAAAIMGLSGAVISVDNTGKNPSGGGTAVLSAVSIDGLGAKNNNRTYELTVTDAAKREVEMITKDADGNIIGRTTVTMPVKSATETKVATVGDLKLTLAINYDINDLNGVVIKTDNDGVDTTTLGAPTYTISTELDRIYVDENLYNISIDKNGNIIGIVRKDGVIKDPLTGENIPVLAEQKVVLGRVAVATFDNQQGLEKVGSNLYRSTANTGEAQYKYPGSDGAGAINPGSLEMSNVDLAQEFTDMIVTQRGFQANSRIITVSDTLLEELVNLKR